MADKFVRPVDMVQGQDVFKTTEVGLTHPNTSAFVRLRDNGDVEIVAGEGLAIVMHPAKRSITFVADSVKFLTRSGTGGLIWNKQALNENANTFNEPALVPVRDEDTYGLYKGVDHFMFGDSATNSPEMVESTLPAELQQVIAPPTTVFPNMKVTDPETGQQVSYEQYYKTYGRPPPFGGA